MTRPKWRIPGKINPAGFDFNANRKVWVRGGGSRIALTNNIPAENNGNGSFAE
jgi:hypothetical protein